MSIEQPNGRRKRDDQNKKNSTKNGVRPSGNDPNLFPVALVTSTRMMMNLVNMDPANSPDVPLKRNPSGFVAIPTNRTVPYLAKAILRNVTVCSYCWKQGDLLLGPDGHSWSIDHVIPLYMGGFENLSNIVKCCQTCRAWKGRHIVAPHPETSWAAATPEIGHELWMNADEIYRGNLVVQPFIMEIATEEEVAVLTAQWRLTQPV